MPLELPERSRTAQSAYDKMPSWQQRLVEWVENDLGRRLELADYRNISWDVTDHSLTIEAPLVRELEARNREINRLRSESDETGE